MLRRVSRPDNQLELELELIQTHMTQKPVLRVEEGARALRNQTKEGGGEFSGLWVRSLKFAYRALKTGNDRQKEQIPLQS